MAINAIASSPRSTARRAVIASLARDRSAPSYSCSEPAGALSRASFPVGEIAPDEQNDPELDRRRPFAFTTAPGERDECSEQRPRQAERGLRLFHLVQAERRERLFASAQ